MLEIITILVVLSVIFIIGPAVVVFLLAILYRLWPLWLAFGLAFGYWVLFVPVN